MYQFQKKCKNLRSYGVASGSNTLSYMSFVAAVITLVVNINNNINANKVLQPTTFAAYTQGEKFNYFL